MCLLSPEKRKDGRGRRGRRGWCPPRRSDAGLGGGALGLSFRLWWVSFSVVTGSTVISKLLKTLTLGHMLFISLVNDFDLCIWPKHIYISLWVISSFICFYFIKSYFKGKWEDEIFSDHLHPSELHILQIYEIVFRSFLLIYLGQMLLIKFYF